MNPMTFTRMVQLDSLIALAVHLWFNKFEPSLGVAIASLLAFPFPFAFLLLSHASSTLYAITVAYSVFSVTLLTSIISYRISPFHPLAKYPGPIMCKISKMWGTWVAIEGNGHIRYKELHDQYGSIVRIGPNELSIVDKDLIPFTLGAQGMPKGPIWDGRRFGNRPEGKDYDTLIDVRDLQIHTRLRRAWNRSFGNGPLKDYEEILTPRAIQLGEELERICRKQSDNIGHVDIAEWISFFAFDFMGDMAFGGCFELMRDGDTSGFWKNMESGLLLPGIAQNIPWFSVFLRDQVPFIGRGMNEFMAFGTQQARRRAKMDVKRKDLFYHMTTASDEDSTESESLTESLAVSNALLTIVAGSDTTASLLSNIVYYLLTNHSDYKRLREEVDQAFPVAEVAPLVSEKLSEMKFLNAVINETLRLQPSVPSSLQRAPSKGSGGKILGSIFIPEGTAVQIPPYTYHRDPRYFYPYPDKFWPERWISEDSGLILERAAFIPFSTGPANCAGRNLAMMEMRFIVALLVKKFDMCFEESYDPCLWEQGLKDRLVFSKGQLPVKLVLRQNI